MPGGKQNIGMSNRFKPARTAVLSMDYQKSIVSNYLKDGQEAFLSRVAGVLKHARAQGMMVIHVRVGFRSGLPEIGSRNPLFNALKASPQRQQMFQGELAEIHPSVGPEGDDIVITKHRVSAFAGTDLEMILRAHDIDSLVLLGIATSGVVLSTLLDASDADYSLTVLKDCCIDQDVELHSCLIEKLFARRASLLTAAEFMITS
jgi:nicotinamidase-related amidase